MRRPKDRNLSNLTRNTAANILYHAIDYLMRDCDDNPFHEWHPVGQAMNILKVLAYKVEKNWP